MRYLVMIGILLAFGGINISAQKKTDKIVWQSGKVVLYTYKVDTKTLTYTHTDISKEVTDPQREEKKEVPIRNDYMELEIQTTEGKYIVLQNLRFIWQKKLDLKEGDLVEIAAKDGSIYVKTTKGKKAKYRYALFLPKEPAGGSNL